MTFKEQKGNYFDCAAIKRNNKNPNKANPFGVLGHILASPERKKKKYMNTLQMNTLQKKMVESTLVKHTQKAQSEA